MEGPGRYEFLDWPGPIPFAHRGGASDAPENTMPAFANAVALGYRYVETDVHVTADGVLLAFHDDRLDRVTDRRGDLALLPWSEVRWARVAGREPIPKLEDLLGEWPDLRVNIDPKHAAAVGPLVEAIHRTKSIDRVCVGSFSDRRLTRLRSTLGPRLCTALGPLGVGQLWLESRRVRARARGQAGARAACAQVPPRQGRLTVVDRRFVDAAHRRGLPVHVWTVDDADAMTRLLDLGVDGIMTDRPAVLRGVLERRGLWRD
jgi:glycerophosphoryl diester phosphodiesterase